jgi:malic enzyme
MPEIVLLTLYLTKVHVLFLQSIKPTVLTGTSGVGRTFTKEVVQAMASFNEVICLNIIVVVQGVTSWNQ